MKATRAQNLLAAATQLNRSTNRAQKQYNQKP